MAEKITIGISAVSNIITSKAGRNYFTLESNDGGRFICFVPNLHEHCIVGSSIEADVTKKEGDTTRLENIYKDGQPIVKPQAQKGQRPSFTGRSEESYAKERQSIERQTALKSACGLITDKPISKEQILEYAEVFYRFLSGNLGIGDEQVLQLTLKMLRGGQDEIKAPEEVKGSKTNVEEQPQTKQLSPTAISGGLKTKIFVEFEALAQKKFRRDTTIISWLKTAFDPTIAKDVDWRQFFNSLPQDKQEDLFNKLKKHSTTPASLK